MLLLVLLLLHPLVEWGAGWTCCCCYCCGGSCGRGCDAASPGAASKLFLKVTLKALSVGGVTEKQAECIDRHFVEWVGLVTQPTREDLYRQIH
jgi:hypothetical protein